MELTKSLGQEFKRNYIRLIASGHIESSALSILEVDWIDFFELCSKDPEFRLDIEKARHCRADKWVDDIALSLGKKYYFPFTQGREPIERAPTKEETSHDKLQFEKRKFLAQADNPDKYGGVGGKKSVAISVDLSDFKLLSPQESIKVLNSDPFNKMATIDAEIITEDKDGPT